MKLLGMKNCYDGKYLHGYELTYENRAGREKTFEMVSRSRLSSPSEIGGHVSGVTIVAWQDDRLLLLKEFRMSINRSIFNLCAGMLEEGETPEACAARELYEETGLHVARFIDILPPSYSAVGFSDTATWLVIHEAEGDICVHASENEEISAAFYTRRQVEELLKTETFSSRSQTVAWFFKNEGMPDN